MARDPDDPSRDRGRTIVVRRLVSGAVPALVGLTGAGLLLSYDYVPTAVLVLAMTALAIILAAFGALDLLPGAKPDRRP